MHRVSLSIALTSGLVFVAGCSATASSEDPPQPRPSPGADQSSDAGSQRAGDALAARAAAAKDLRFVADYELTRKDADPVTVVVSLAEDGTWSVEVPGGAHDGDADVTIVRHNRGYHQCVIDYDDEDDFCVHLAAQDSEMPAAVDPELPNLFTTWLNVWMERSAPLSVTFDDSWDDVDSRAQCFSVETNAVTVSAPIPPGTYCFDDAGVLAGAKADFGTLLLDGEVAAAPDTAELPADVTDDEPLPTEAPPSPSPSPSEDDEDEEDDEDD